MLAFVKRNLRQIKTCFSIVVAFIYKLCWRADTNVSVDDRIKDPRSSSNNIEYVRFYYGTHSYNAMDDTGVC